MFQDSVTAGPNSQESETVDTPQKSLNEKQQVSSCKKVIKQTLITKMCLIFFDIPFWICTPRHLNLPRIWLMDNGLFGLLPFF